MQEKNRDKKKVYLCFVDIEKAFDRVLEKVMEWAMRKKGCLPEVIVRVLMSPYHGAKTKVQLGSESSEAFSVNIKNLCCHHRFLQLQWM